jgi:hypothetical protein
MNPPFICILNRDQMKTALVSSWYVLLALTAAGHNNSLVNPFPFDITAENVPIN